MCFLEREQRAPNIAERSVLMKEVSAKLAVFGGEARNTSITAKELLVCIRGYSLYIITRATYCILLELCSIVLIQCVIIKIVFIVF
jgi:hypothetical protein